MTYVTIAICFIVGVLAHIGYDFFVARAKKNKKEATLAEMQKIVESAIKSISSDPLILQAAQECDSKDDSPSDQENLSQ